MRTLLEEADDCPRHVGVNAPEASDDVLRQGDRDDPSRRPELRRTTSLLWSFGARHSTRMLETNAQADANTVDVQPLTGREHAAVPVLHIDQHRAAKRNA